MIDTIFSIDKKSLNLFDCGQDDLNIYLKKYALKNDKLGYGKTFVLKEKNKLIGYFTLCSASIKFNEFPLYTSDLPKYPIPCIKIARLAIDKKYQGQGYGKQLLKDAFIRILNVAQQIGVRIILVDAKETSLKYYLKFGFKKLQEESSTLYLLIDTLLEAV